jgi:hypothetical protein
MLLNAGQGKMKKLFLCISIAFILSGCAELDHAGEVVLREVRSINIDNPESYEESGGPPEDLGKDLDANEETSKK